jgi:hypothetical protein
MEHHFRQFTYAYRRIHGNRSVRRNLVHIPEQLPLVQNLTNPDYIHLVFEDESKIARRFSEIDVEMIRAMSTEHHSKQKSLGSCKTRRVLRQPNFTKDLTTAFAAVAG